MGLLLYTPPHQDIEDECQKQGMDVLKLTLFSTAFWPTYLARGVGGYLPPRVIFDFRAQKSGFKGKAVYHPKI